MRGRIIAIAAAALAAAVTTGGAAAGEHRHDGDRDRGRYRPAGAISPAYAKECGACHVAYPPKLLSAASWRRVLAGLDRHFGQNAELEPEVRADLEAWLVERAGTDRGGAPLRVTETAHFVREHDEVPASAIARPTVRSLANCAACHPGAERWDFDEDRVKIPR
jgi:hypothetical protein